MGTVAFNLGTVVRDADIRVWVKILDSFSFVLTCKLNKKLIHCKKPKLNLSKTRIFTARQKYTIWKLAEKVE